MMLLAKSKLKDAENIYMRYLYDKHKHDLPKGTVEHKNVSSSDEAESKWLFIESMRDKLEWKEI